MVKQILGGPPRVLGALAAKGADTSNPAAKPSGAATQSARLSEGAASRTFMTQRRALFAGGWP